MVQKRPSAHEDTRRSERDYKCGSDILWFNSVTFYGSRHTVRHLLAVSQELHTNGSTGRTILLRYRREEAWATLVSFLGLPADPTWADHILEIVEGKKRIEEIDGIGCQPVLISATTEEVLEWIGDGLRSRVLSFPERNGPIVWPRFALLAVQEI
jgi:hypothetical protein